MLRDAGAAKSLTKKLKPKGVQAAVIAVLRVRKRVDDGLVETGLLDVVGGDLWDGIESLKSVMVGSNNNRWPSWDLQA